MTKTLFAASITVALSGCVGTPYPWINDQAEVNRRFNSNLDILCSVSRTTEGFAQQKVIDEGLMTKEEVTLALNDKIKMGMNRCALLASWGLPNHVNKTVTAGGVNEQFVYSGREYVYITNGKVSGWQTSRR
jgi:hypothetical protein